MPISHGRPPSSSVARPPQRAARGALAGERLRAAPRRRPRLRALRLGDDALRGGLLGEALELARQALLVPAELARELSPTRRSGAPGCSTRALPRRERAGAAVGGGQLARGQQPQARAPQQHVADAARLLAAGGERDLGEQVGQPGDDRLGELAALGREREHLVGGVAVAGGERRVGRLAGTPSTRGSSSTSIACPSGISCVRQGASRASRSTSRSTVIFAIRRHVVSLPPVIVIMPEEVSYSSALREMSTDFFGSPVEISGRTPAKAPVSCAGPSSVREELVDRVEQVVDVLARGPDVLERALVVVVGGADQRVPEPRQREDRAPAAGGHDRAADERQVLVAERDVRAAAGPDARQLGLVVELARDAARRPTRRSR